MDVDKAFNFIARTSLRFVRSNVIPTLYCGLFAVVCIWVGIEGGGLPGLATGITFLGGILYGMTITFGLYIEMMIEDGEITEEDIK